MGSDVASEREAPVHLVHLGPFELADRCVTAWEYFEFVKSVGEGFQEAWCDYIDPCLIIRTGLGYELRPGVENLPMIQVSWTGSAAYCNWRSQVEGLDPVYDLEAGTGDVRRDGYRLPTEAEWEYVCATAHPDAALLPPDDAGRFNYRGATAEVAQGWASRRRRGGFAFPAESPVEVATLPPDGHGLYELLGNVREWCHDYYSLYTTEPQEDPVGPPHGIFRVVRGGSFLDGPEMLGPRVRAAVREDNKCMQYGFRMARSRV